MVVSKTALQIMAHSVFEKTKLINEYGQEYWTARWLSKILGYSEYRHFIPVIDKAKESCRNSNHDVKDHFEDSLDMVETGSGAKREVNDIKLSRYACYLVVQNADPAKEIVAIGQTYFAIQTRKQELQEQEEYNALKTEREKRLFLREELKKHNKQLAGTAKGAGVIAPVDYAIFQDHGYKGLYNGLSAKDIHTKKQLNKNQNILDHMGSTELAANLFRATQTEEKLRRDNVKDKRNANATHYDVGRKVRKTIEELGGTMPEKLPTMDGIQKKIAKKPTNT
jgi:DNA-damage-inducible protein D